MDVQPTPQQGTLRSRLHNFFYHEEVPYSLALLRIVLPIVLLEVMVPRWFHVRELFSADGAAAPIALNYGVTNFPPEPTGMLAVALVTALIVSLITASIGWMTRVSLVIAFVLYTYLNLLDCLSTLTKYSVISSHLLLLLSVSPCGAVWSVDSWRKRRDRGETAASISPPTFAVWPQQLIRIFIGLVYLGASTTKMHTESYFTSDQLRYWLITNLNNDNPMGEWLSFYPWVVIVMAHIAIVWQIVFVFLVWRPVVRWVVLGIGVLFHAATTPLFGLFVFPQVMIASYIAFADEKHVVRLVQYLRRACDSATGASSLQRLSRRLQSIHLPPRVASGAVWVGLLATTTLAGVAAESFYDPYGLNRPEGSHQLRPLSPELVTRFMSPKAPVPFRDHILSFEIGTRMLGGVLLDSRAGTERDESLICQVTIAPPHADVWIDMILKDDAGVVVHRTGQVVPRERLRAEWSLVLPASWPAGSYTVALQHEGETIAARRIAVR